MPPNLKTSLHTHTHFLNQSQLSSRAEAFIFWIAVLPDSIPFPAIKALFICDINNNKI